MKEIDWILVRSGVLVGLQLFLFLAVMAGGFRDGYEPYVALVVFWLVSLSTCMSWCEYGLRLFFYDMRGRK